MRSCKQCGALIPVEAHKAVRYCSPACRQKAAREARQVTDYVRPSRAGQPQRVVPDAFKKYGVKVLEAPDVPGGYQAGAKFTNQSAYQTLREGAFDAGMIIEVSGKAKKGLCLKPGTFRVKPESEWIKNGHGSYKPLDSLEKI